MTRLRSLVFAAGLAVALFASPALACPTCGIGDRLAGWGLVIYGAFMFAPFFLAYGVYRYIKNLGRGE
jgi:hypothetical protein